MAISGVGPSGLPQSIARQNPVVEPDPLTDEEPLSEILEQDPPAAEADPVTVEAPPDTSTGEESAPGWRIDTVA